MSVSLSVCPKMRGRHIVVRWIDQVYVVNAVTQYRLNFQKKTETQCKMLKGLIVDHMILC